MFSGRIADRALLVPHRWYSVRRCIVYVCVSAQRVNVLVEGGIPSGVSSIEHEQMVVAQHSTTFRRIIPLMSVGEHAAWLVNQLVWL